MVPVPRRTFDGARLGTWTLGDRTQAQDPPGSRAVRRSDHLDGQHSQGRIQTPPPLPASAPRSLNPKLVRALAPTSRSAEKIAAASGPSARPRRTASFAPPRRCSRPSPRRDGDGYPTRVSAALRSEIIAKDLSERSGQLPKGRRWGRGRCLNPHSPAVFTQM